MQLLEGATPWTCCWSAPAAPPRDTDRWYSWPVKPASARPCCCAGFADRASRTGGPPLRNLSGPPLRNLSGPPLRNLSGPPLRNPSNPPLWGLCDPLSTPRPLGPLRDVAAALSPGLPEMLRAGARPLLLVVTYRDAVGADHPLRPALGDLVSTPDARRLQLAPLSSSAVAELLSGRDLDVEVVHRRTAGNPFFVSQIAAQPDSPLPRPTHLCARAESRSPTVPMPHTQGGSRIPPAACEFDLGYATNSQELCEIGRRYARSPRLAPRPGTRVDHGYATLR